MERSRQHELQLLRLLTNQTVNQTSGSYGNAAVPSQMYGNTVPNSPGFPLQPFCMYQAQYPPLHQGQSYILILKMYKYHVMLYNHQGWNLSLKPKGF